MVVVSAVMGRRDASAALVLRAVETGDIRLAVSDEGYRELVEVMDYEEIRSRIVEPARAFEVALDIGTMGILYHPWKHDWPTLPDPRDGWLLDLAYESGSDFVVTRDRHLLDRAPVLEELGFVVLAPAELLRRLRS